MRTISELSSTDQHVLDSWFGVNGVKKSLSEIGKTLDPPVTRQRVKQILDRIKKDIGEAEWKKLEKQYEQEIVLSPKQVERERAYRRGAITRYLRTASDPEIPLQYLIVHARLGVPVPEHRISDAPHYDELQSCQAFMEDYDARVFGRYRYCTKCKTIKAMGNFYEMPSRGGYPWQICRTCNTERQRSYYSRYKKVPTTVAEQD